MQEKKSLEEFENLASKLNDFCLRIIGHEEPLKFEVGEEVVAIYATNSKYEEFGEEKLEEFVKESRESEGKFLCLKLRDRRLICKELNCNVSMPFLGYLPEEFSLSTLIIFKFLTDTLSFPILPGIFFPLKTLWGPVVPTDPNVLCSCFTPWVAFLPENPHLFTAPWKPFPLERPEILTLSPS